MAADLSNTPPQSHRQTRVGLAYGLAAYITWGLFPLYFKQVAHVAAIQVLSHRILWSIVFVAGLLACQHRWADVLAALRSRRTMLTLAGSTLLIAANWFLFIYAIAKGYVLHASLGYYINPLVNVLLGIVFLRERLRLWQAIGLILAAIGVLNMALSLGHFPWIALGLALSFGFYGLLRKTVAAGPLVGLSVETTLLLPLAIGLIGRDLPQALSTYTAGTWGWLILAGPLTAIPLLWFANAARRLRLATMGFIQYLTPTGHFLLAVFLYHEPFTPAHAITFTLIWVALVIYTVDSFRSYRAIANSSSYSIALPAPAR